VESAVDKPIHKPKIDFYNPLSLYISNLYGRDVPQNGDFKSLGMVVKIDKTEVKDQMD